MGVRFFAELDPRAGLLLRAAGAAENPAVRRRRTAFWSMIAKFRLDSKRKMLALPGEPGSAVSQKKAPNMAWKPSGSSPLWLQAWKKVADGMAWHTTPPSFKRLSSSG